MLYSPYVLQYWKKAMIRNIEHDIEILGHKS